MGASNIDQLNELVATLNADWEKFSKGNKSAGTRVRKACQDLKKVAQEIRVEVQETKTKAE